MPYKDKGRRNRCQRDIYAAKSEEEREEIRRKSRARGLANYHKNSEAINARRRAKRKVSNPDWKRARDAWYARSGGEIRAKQRAVFAKKAARLAQAKSHPCTDCGRVYPSYVMDFDHVRGEKIGEVGQMIHRRWEIIEAEIAKCDLVCSNCHRMRTHERKERRRKQELA